MAKIFKYSDYDNNVEKLMNAIWTWIERSRCINTKDEFYIKVEQECLPGDINDEKYRRWFY